MARTINEMWGRQPSSVKVDKTLTATLLRLWRCLTDLHFGWALRTDEYPWADWIRNIFFRERRRREQCVSYWKERIENNKSWPWSQQTSKSKKRTMFSNRLSTKQIPFQGLFFMSSLLLWEKERERKKENNKLCLYQQTNQRWITNQANVKLRLW